MENKHLRINLKLTALVPSRIVQDNPRLDRLCRGGGYRNTLATGRLE